MKIVKQIYFILLISLFCLCSVVNATDDPLHSYKDYLIIMVHGVGASYHTWVGQDYKESQEHDKLYEYLTNPIEKGGLNCSGNVFVYSFSEESGYIPQNIQELGNPNFKNPATHINGDNTKFEAIQSKCWIEQARWDYAKRIADKSIDFDDANDVLKKRPDLIPKKIIFITHSMGNFAVRGYILSDELAARGAFDNVSGVTSRNAVWSESSVKNQGFYRGDVDKVVFVDPVLLGSETPTFVYCNFVLQNLKLFKKYAPDTIKYLASKLKDIYVQGNNANNRIGINFSPELKTLMDGLAKGGEIAWDALGVYLTAVVVQSVLTAGTPPDPMAIHVSALMMQAAIELTRETKGNINIFEKCWDEADKFVKYLDKIGGYNCIEAPINLYTDFLVKTSSVMKDALLQDIVKTYLAYGFSLNMGTPAIGGSQGSGILNRWGDISRIDDSLNYQGMARLLKDITLDNVNEKYRNTENKDKYKPIKYSTVVGQGSVDCDAELTRIATAVDIGNETFNGLANTFRVDTNIGIPGADIAGWAMDNPYLIALLKPGGDFYSLKTTSAKLMALTMAQFGSVTPKAGDFVVSEESQSGEGITELAGMKKYKDKIYPEKLEEFLNTTLPEEIAGIEGTILFTEAFITHGSLPNAIKGLLRIMPLLDMAQKCVCWKDDIVAKLVPHTYATDRPNFGLITQALYEPPSIKIDGMYRELKGNEIEAYNLPTPSTQAQRVTLAPAPANNSEEGRANWPDYVLVSTTNIPIPYGRAGGTPPQLIALQDTYYARITTFDYTVGANGDSSSSGGDTIQVYHPQLNKNVWAANLATKADSMILRGTLEDLTPRVGMTAEYSFNFAAWQPLPVVNDYGHFELPITLAEGQNIVTFREQNKAGYTGHQFLRIIKSSTPMLPGSDTDIV